MRVQVGFFFLVFFRDGVDDTVFYEGRAFDELYHWHSLRPLSDDYDRTKSDIKGTYWGDKLTSGQKRRLNELKGFFFNIELYLLV